MVGSIEKTYQPQHSIAYKESRLYLDYDVSVKICDMIRNTSKSLDIIGYKFIADCDEGRDIFLALHQLGVRCTQEQRQVDITIAIDSRAGLSAALYRKSDIRGLDWLQSLQILYPMLRIKIAKVQHTGRDTIHTKAVVADNLVMLKSGEGSVFNQRNKSQGENGILFSSKEMSDEVREIIENNVKKSNSLLITETHLPSIITSQAHELLPNNNTEITTSIVVSQEFDLNRFNRLKENIDELSCLDSNTFNTFEEYSSLQNKCRDCINEIHFLNKNNYNSVLKKLYQNYNEMLSAKCQWLSMMLEIENDLSPQNKSLVEKIKKAWQSGETASSISTRLKIEQQKIEKVILRLKVNHQKESLEKVLKEFSSIPGLKNGNNKEKNQQSQNLEEKYEAIRKELETFSKSLPNENEALKTSDQVELLLEFEYIWERLFNVFEQLKQSGNGAKKIINLLNSEESSGYPLSDNDSLDLTDSEEESVDFFEDTPYDLLFNFLERISTKNNNTKDNLETPFSIYRSRYDQLSNNLDSFNRMLEVEEKESTLLFQTESTALSGHDSDSAYKKAFLENINKLSGNNSSVKIAVSNLNDREILGAIKDACNRGVIVQIAIGKYMNYFSESLPGGGGTNEAAILDLNQSIDEEARKNLQVRWLVFDINNNERSIGSKKITKGTHRKYVSFHENHAEKNKIESYCLLGSSPLDNQAQYYSQELDVMLSDPEQINTADKDLFEAEYNTGAEQYFCLAINCLQKAGFSYTADLQYQRYLASIDLLGHEARNEERKDCLKNLVNFIDSQIKSGPNGKVENYLLQAKQHIENLPGQQANISSVESENLVVRQLDKLALALDQYNNDKKNPNKKYLSLLHELRHNNNISDITKTVTQRIREQTGSLHTNSFAVFLAKNEFFENIKTQDKSDKQIISDIKISVLTPDKSSSNFSNGFNMFSFNHRNKIDRNINQHEVPIIIQ